MKKVAVLLAGGVGSRLYPLSSEEKPKQFINLISSQPILDDSIDRIKPIFSRESIFINSVDKYRDYLRNKPYERIMEPHRAGTTASVLYITLFLMRKFGDCVITLLPADHYIGNHEKYLQALEDAQTIAENSGDVVLLGIQPTKADTGYGYINHDNGKVIEFTEKPNEELANKYVANDYVWNSGIFTFRASVMYNLYKQKLDSFSCFYYSFSRGIMESFYRNTEIEPKSFEKAIIETANNVSVIPADFEWSDIGDWERYNHLLSEGVL